MNPAVVLRMAKIVVMSIVVRVVVIAERRIVNTTVSFTVESFAWFLEIDE